MSGQQGSGRGNVGEARAGAAQLPPLQRWRLILDRDASDEAQRDHEIAWETALAASSLPCARAAFGRRAPRITFAVPLPVGMAGEAELAEILLTERRRSADVRRELESVVPDGTRLLDLHDVWVGAPGLPSLVAAADYRIEPAPNRADAIAGRLADAIAKLLAAPSLPRTRGDRTYDLRPLVATLVLDGATLRCRLRHDQALGTGRPDELVAALEEVAGGAIPLLRIVRERLVLTEDAPGG